MSSIPPDWFQPRKEQRADREAINSTQALIRTPEASQARLSQVINELGLQGGHYGPFDEIQMTPYPQTNPQTCFVAAAINTSGRMGQGAVLEDKIVTEVRSLDRTRSARPLFTSQGVEKQDPMLPPNGVAFSSPQTEPLWSQLLGKHLGVRVTPLTHQEAEHGQRLFVDRAEEMIVTEIALGNTVIIGGNWHGRGEWIGITGMRVGLEGNVSFFCTIPGLPNFAELNTQQMGQVLREGYSPSLWRVGIQMPNYSESNYRNGTKPSFPLSPSS